jgi:glycerophosphoryl diester phosphodiesterase
MPEPVTRPLNLGHRGARSLAPENTLAGMAVAMQVGAHGVEFDVQRTADGHLVVFHDDDLKRICSVDGRIVASTLAQLRELDAGRHFGPQFAGELIPTLNEVIETLPAHAFLNIEAKRFRFRSDGLEAGIAQAFRRYNLLGRCIVSSFNPVLLWRLRRIDRTIPLGLLYAPDLPFGFNRGWPRWLLRLKALHPHFEQVTPKLVQQAHARGQQINTWTVNEPAEMRRLIDLGVDSIITDRPDLLAEILSQGGAG